MAYADVDPLELARKFGGVVREDDALAIAKKYGAKVTGASTAPAVYMNAVNKAIAGIPDALLNAPTNVMNLAKAGAGMVAPSLDPQMSEPPNYVNRAMRSAGMITDAEPQDAQQRMVSTAIQGGVGGLASPAGGLRQLIGNAVAGLSGGGAAGATRETTDSEPLAIAAGMAAPMAPALAARAVVGKPRAMNETEARTLETARAKDYVLPPSETNSSWIGNRLESIAGKAALKQDAGSRNQAATNAIASEELGISGALSPAKLEAYRYAQAQPYREIAAVSPLAEKVLERLKATRHEASAQHKFYDRSADPKALKEARLLDNTAEDLETALEKIATRANKPGLVEELRVARQNIAKSYDIERAMNKGNADVSAPDLGRALDRNRPLTGGLKTTAQFAQAFPQYATEGARIPTPGVSKVEALSSGLLGLLGYGAAGPAGVAAAGLPLLSSPTRNMLLSKPYQGMLSSAWKPLTEKEIRALMIGRAVSDRQEQ